MSRIRPNRVFTAQYSGQCLTCTKPIKMGHWIRRAGGYGYVHFWHEPGFKITLAGIILTPIVVLCLLAAAFS